MDKVSFLTAKPIEVDVLEERARATEPGAVVSFQGVVRQDRTPRGEVTALSYEAYEAMAEAEMGRILGELEERWPGTRALCQHRVGTVPVGETSLFLVVSSPRRSDAFLACHHALEQMKTRIPLWKKEIFSGAPARWSCDHRETMLISDSVLTFPPS